MLNLTTIYQRHFEQHERQMDVETISFSEWSKNRKTLPK